MGWLVAWLTNKIVSPPLPPKVRVGWGPFERVPGSPMLVVTTHRHRCRRVGNRYARALAAFEDAPIARLGWFFMLCPRARLSRAYRRPAGLFGVAIGSSL